MVGVASRWMWPLVGVVASGGRGIWQAWPLASVASGGRDLWWAWPLVGVVSGGCGL